MKYKFISTVGVTLLLFIAFPSMVLADESAIEETSSDRFVESPSEQIGEISQDEQKSEEDILDFGYRARLNFETRFIRSTRLRTQLRAGCLPFNRNYPSPDRPSEETSIEDLLPFSENIAGEEQRL